MDSDFSSQLIKICMEEDKPEACFENRCGSELMDA